MAVKFKSKPWPSNRNQMVQIMSVGEQLFQRSQRNSKPTKIYRTLSLITDFILNGKD